MHDGDEPASPPTTPAPVPDATAVQVRLLCYVFAYMQPLFCCQATKMMMVIVSIVLLQLYNYYAIVATRILDQFARLIDECVNRTVAAGRVKTGCA